MSSVQSQRTVRLHVENVGGIDETDVELGAGVNVLAGRNATNRTSLLQAIMAVLGSERASLKGDADAGRVEMRIGDDTYTRTLSRSNGTVTFGGDPYLDDPVLADLFALLLESNESRQAVARGENLRELIMRPVDTDAIQREIEDLEREKRELESRLDSLEEKRVRLPSLEERRTALEEDIADLDEEIEAKQQELQESDLDVEDGREDHAALQEKLSELRSLRADLEETDFDLETERESLRSLRAERDEVSNQLEDLSEVPGDEKAELEREIEQLRARKRGVESTVSQLQNLIQFNERVLEGEGERVFDLLHEDGHEPDDGALTDQLVENGTVTCWTCGTSVETDAIEATVESLRDLRKEQVTERTQIQQDLDERKSAVESITERENDRRRIERRLDRLENQIESTETRIERLKTRRAELNEEIQAVEERVEDLREEDFDRVLDLHREVNELEFERDRKRDELDDVVTELEAVERELDRAETLERDREDINEQLEDCRTRIERLEANAVEQFNDHMARVLDILGYDNLERIWIERTEREVRQGRRKVTESHFDLHVVRSTDSGAAYEDTVDHLSESEREVTGLVFALAGFLVHDVHETVPFMLLDSLEAVDSDRISKLVDYFERYPSYLVVALLPEDAAALADEYTRVTDI